MNLSNLIVYLLIGTTNEVFCFSFRKIYQLNAFRHVSLPKYHLLRSMDYGKNEIIQEQFCELTSSGCKENGKLSYVSFLEWQEIQAMLADGVVNVEEVQGIWQDNVGSLDTCATYPEFEALSLYIDTLFDEEDEYNGDMETYNDGEEMRLVDIWDASLNPREYMEQDFFAYLQNFYSNNMAKDGAESGLAYTSFAEWEDVKSMLREGEVDNTCLKDIWKEAIVFKTKQAERNGRKVDKITDELDLDCFLRLNIRLDQVMDEIADALQSLTDADVEQYYRGEYSRLLELDGQNALSYETVLEWNDVQDLLSNQVVTIETVDELWESLPKKALRAGVSEGIDVDAFLAFNSALEDMGGSSEMMK
jgi:hypothetical protein